MPDVRMPDGTIIRNVPEGTTRAQLQVRYSKAAPKADSRPTSFWQGVKQGVATPLYNMARLVETADDAVGGALKSVGNAISAPLDATLGRALEAAGLIPEKQSFPTVNAAEAAFKKRQAAKPVRGSKVGEFVGNVAGTLPTAALPGGAFAQGAYSTGLLTNQREPDLIAAEMAVGGALGKVGEKALKGIAGKIAPKASESLRQLTHRGVRVTPGQATRESQNLPGRFLTAFEDRATSLPGPTGQLARAGRERAAQDFVRGSIDDVLGELGKKLPADIPVGNKAVGYAQKAAGSAYDDALVNMRMVPDDQFKQEIAQLVSGVRGGDLAAPQLKQFQQIVVPALTGVYNDAGQAV